MEASTTPNHLAPTPSPRHTPADAPRARKGRRGFLKMAGLGTAALAAAGGEPAQAQAAKPAAAAWDKIFARSARVDHRSVGFENRFGILLSADLYLPKGLGDKKFPAIVVGGPFGGVKEQAAGLYAQTLAERGFVTIAFDPSFNGQSGGKPRGVASPEIFTEDFSAAVDYLGLQGFVDRNRMGLMGVCGSGGFGLSAASVDKRIRAVATASMYDISRQYARGMGDSQTPEERHQRLTSLSLQRWKDAESGSPAPMPYMLPDRVDDKTHPVVREFFDYYATPRGYHERSPNSNKSGNFTETSFQAFMNFPQLTNLADMSPRPVLLVAGENAHSRYFSEDAFKGLVGPKELVIIPNTNHVDLYDQSSKIPFDKLAAFFGQHLS